MNDAITICINNIEIYEIYEILQVLFDMGTVIEYDYMKKINYNCMVATLNNIIDNNIINSKIFINNRFLTIKPYVKRKTQINNNNAYKKGYKTGEYIGYTRGFKYGIEMMEKYISDK
jgi:hypothetical protein